jgi:hypothetical protein
MPDEVNKHRGRFNREHAGCTPPAQLPPIRAPEHLVAIALRCPGCGAPFQMEFIAGLEVWRRPDVSDAGRN